MTLPRTAHHSSFSTFVRAFCTLALTSLFSPVWAQQQDNSAVPTGAPAGWHSDDARHLIGLTDIKEKAKGSLSITPATLIFASPEGQGSVDRSEISSVTVGDVRVETGGTAGKITRAIIPFGGGSAVATMTNKQLSLLTVEFRDRREAFHGVVFLLPKDEAVLAQQQLGAPTLLAPVQQPQRRCEVSGSGVLPNTLKVTAMMTQGDPVPAEYRVLLYEQLVRQFRKEGTFTSVYRDGDDDLAAACPTYNLVLTLDAFKKGNAAVRASTGPVGYFVGATSLKFHVQVRGLNGEFLLDKDLKASQRGDTDSLDIADKIAKSLTKDLKKASKRSGGL